MSQAVNTAPTGPIRRVSLRRATSAFCLLAVIVAAVAVAAAAAVAAAVGVALAGLAAAFGPSTLVVVSSSVPVPVAVIVIVCERGWCDRVGEHARRLGFGRRLRRRDGRKCSRGRGCGRGCRSRSRLRRAQVRSQRVHCRNGLCAGPRDPGSDHVRGRHRDHACRLRDRRGGRSDVNGLDGTVHDAVPFLLRRGLRALRLHGCRRRCRDMGKEERRSHLRRPDQAARQEQKPTYRRERQRPRAHLRP